MTSDTFNDIEKLETDLWEAADNLRANSKLTSSDYFMPVLGIIFLRHAANRFEAAHRQIDADQTGGTMPKRQVRPADYIARRSLYLPKKARYDWIMQQAAVSGADLPKIVTEAMTAIESEFEPLLGVLPKDYGIFETTVLEDLMRLFNSEQIKQATGDVFGRIYEYFLAKFSIQKAHDNGEFFTPSSIVQAIVNVIEPDHGTVFDPACGSGGMFVQSSHFIEHEGGDTAKKVVFYGQEKNRDTIRIAKMNLAVHGLEGKIAEAITYYQDGHSLAGTCDFVMANPPFNVDLVDAERIKGDPRLPFGLPGVNKQKKVGNGNYLWISYFWSYLSAKGRAGFVMSSQASSAGHGEKEVRQGPNGLGRCRMRPLADASAASLHAFVTDQVEPGARVITDGWAGYRGLEKLGSSTTGAARGPPGRTGTTPANSFPAVHRVASLAKRWLLGTHQGSVGDAHVAGYLNEFAFRFNRRRSRSRGMVFYRVLECAVAHGPVRYQDLIASVRPRAVPPTPPHARGHPPSLDRPPAHRPWRTVNPGYSG